MPRGNNKKFIDDIAKFKVKTELTINDTRKLLAFDLFSRVIDRTPIFFSFQKNSGNTKYNWQCTIGTMSTRVLKGTDKKGNVTKERMLKVLQRLNGDETVFLANSVPWIWMLEDGLYPKSVVRGSWNKKTKKYEIRSTGGFSKGGDLNADSTKGMVKLTLTEYPEIYKRALRRAQRLNG